MPTVRPFRALRYDQAKVGPLDALVAPPYDVISDEARLEYLERSPYNVVHLTLPDSEQQAADDLRAWREQGVLVEAEPGVWWVAQDYVGPDGVARTREGFAASVPVTPYSAGEVLPHERTHAGPKEGRLRLLRATRTQLEPIFLLYDADPVLARPDGEPELDVEEGGVRTRAWHVPSGEIDDRHAAPDRRRPPPLRDRRRVPRGGAERDAHVRDPRLGPRARASRSSPRTASSRSSATCPARRSRCRATASRSTAAAATRTSTPTTTSARASSSRSTRAASSYTAYADEAVAAVDRGDAGRRVPAPAGDRRAGVALRACAARRCRRSRRSSSRS